jgi:hypothetical protein
VTVLTARKIRPITYICSKALKEAHMLTSRVCQEVPAWLIDSSRATVLGPPPKDPSEGDEDEEDDEDESEEQPAVVSEPDE